MPKVKPFIYDTPEFRSELEQSPHLHGEVETLRSITEPGMIALDVGANRGVTTVTPARAVGPDGRVWACGPVPEYFQLLDTNLGRNAVGNVELHQLAVIDDVGDVAFYKRGGGSGIVPAEGAERLTVRTTVDRFLAEQGVSGVDVISSDCEGSELLMLQGARETLMASSPRIFCEIHHSYLDAMDHCVGDVVSYLEGLGYHVEPLSFQHPGGTVGFDECSHIYAGR